MAEDNQEVEHISYGDKLQDSCTGMCFGFILFFGALGLSAWNEYRSVAQAKTINAASEEWKQGKCSPIMSELEGELVHITCPVSNLDVLGTQDPVLQGIPENERVGIALESYMEVYQWDEHATTTTKDDAVGGGATKTTTYTYSRNWGIFTPDQVNTFHKQGETCKTQNNGNACLNWDPSKVESWWTSAGASLGTKVIDQSKAPMAGDFIIPQSQLNRLGRDKTLVPTCAANTATTTTAPATTTTTAPASNTTTRNLQSSSSTSGTVLSCSPGGDGTLKGDTLFWQQQDSNNQMIDYLSRSYSIRTTEVVSILAMQTSNTFQSWTSPYDEDYFVYEVVDGNLTAEQMLEDLEAENTGLTWFLRFFTLLLVVGGLVLITSPLTVIPDIIPCIGPWVGDLVGTVLYVVDCAIGCCCWTFVTAMAWIAYRPYIGIPLLCGSLCMCAGGGYIMYKNHKLKQTRLNAEAEMAKKKEQEAEEENNEDPEQPADEE